MTYSESRMPAWQRALSDRVAVDIVLAWVLAGAAYIAVAVGAPTPIRVVVGGVALFRLPVYVLAAILFPHRGPVAAPGRLSSLRGLDSVTARERFALSFGLSLAMLPVLGIAVALSPWGFSDSSVAATFAVFVAVGGLLAAVVRRRLPPEDRFRIPVARWAGELRGALFTGSLSERAINAFVLASIVVGLLAVGGALAMPQDGQTFSDFAVLTEDENGELVAGGYPDDLAPDESATLVTAVENHEDETTDYTVVVTAEPRNGGENAGQSVELERYQATVDPGERWTHRHEIQPEVESSEVRVDYYLYRGDAPAQPDAESAYRHLFLWFSVTDGAA